MGALNLGSIGNTAITVTVGDNEILETRPMVRVIMNASYARSVPPGWDSGRLPPGGTIGAIRPPQVGVIGAGVTVLLPAPEASALISGGFAGAA